MESATDLKTIVRRIGAGDIYNGGRAATVPGPGHSSRDRSLSLRVSDDGARVLWYSHANDDAAKPLQETVARWGSDELVTIRPASVLWRD